MQLQGLQACLYVNLFIYVDMFIFNMLSFFFVLSTLSNAKNENNAAI